MAKNIDDYGLFQPPPESIPLAERMRPKTIDDMVGQDHLVGKDGLITQMLQSGSIRPMIFWGPPGTGKTTLSRLLADKVDAKFIQINAISSGVKELREIISDARDSLISGRKTLLFIDEIHRFNKAQQAALLKSVEEGLLILIGATTENPSFEVISPLLSRCQVYTLNSHAYEDLKQIADDALKNDEIIKGTKISEEAKEEMIRLSGGDARVLLNTLEISSSIIKTKESNEIGIDLVKEVFQRSNYIYDQAGDEHYNTISAFIKSVRGSDPDAAVYYLARMLEAGEDPKFIARRLIVLASEDIGNAEPYGLTLATDCFTAVNYVGMPEARIILAQVATYLASCPKSNASYKSIAKASEDVKNNPNLSIPLHIRNAPTKLMKDMGYKKGYKYAHNYEDHFVEDDFLPEELKDRIYYEPTEIGREANLKKYLDSKWKKRGK
ncbi:MAG: AAA family ATPase [Candidatus Dadabacteria bacterium]|nr:AAA family ATPase [Candidatus Dadabacteria bacterium]NIQ14103.1 AAA family ATPase [Candidatus Dadabacteria bacterium]